MIESMARLYPEAPIEVEPTLRALGREVLTLESTIHPKRFWQVTITEDGVKRTLPDKLRAIALDNDLAGEGNHPNQENIKVVVRIGGQDNGENDA